MSKKKTKDEVEQHKIQAIGKLTTLIDAISQTDPMKADKFCYWLEDYCSFLNYEKEFIPTRLKRYKRGDIIKAHLGFNIGSEEGGLHYCIVLDKTNNLSSPALTVLPLTSLKDKHKIEKLRKGELYIGNEIYDSLSQKISNCYSATMKEFYDLSNKSQLKEPIPKSYLDDIAANLNSVKNMQDELNKMKNGSVALIGQITTISKIRIYTPKTKYDTLSGIRLCPDTLDKIDNEICNLFIGISHKN